MRVFIADGAERTSLAIARSLGKRGIEVHCGESYRFSTTALSKYCKKSFIYPDPQKDCKRFIDSLEKILKAEKYDALYSSREVSTIPISYNKERLDHYTKVVFPDYPQMLMTHDKSKTIKLANEIGIPTPKTYFIETIRELEQISDQIEYPVVVKSRYKTIWKDEKPVMLKVTDKNYVYDKDQLFSITTEILDKSGKMPLIQEYIPGGGYGVEILMKNGETKAFFMHKRLREYPISGGASTFRESFYNCDMVNLGLRLMSSLKWHGVGMVEFKLDERDNIPKLIEVNGRFWGSLPLSIASGIDFPYLLYDLLINGNDNSIVNYPEGIKCRWLIPGDLLWFLSAISRNKSKFKVLKEFFTFRGTYYDIISMKDPLPTIGALRGLIKQFLDVVSGRRNISGEVQ
ncbi:putative ATP-grasp superfamily ATP-dependent carboligase [Methanomicrobium sp. W14]|uniref:carboxylate--amine ligase n=1 Tax=Methanomicrobium sp. W14 TaxID=2817839 RepID=UPI001AE40BB1|nr:ATP-grasp domain-containing protein [Methanomicrobium sp. W14]MBP2133113.1 putative ATP-grasp superfamily ATP-dependent carboligase [Methanomicrobium sp. W14]